MRPLRGELFWHKNELLRCLGVVAVDHEDEVGVKAEPIRNPWGISDEELRRMGVADAGPVRDLLYHFWRHGYWQGQEDPSDRYWVALGLAMVTAVAAVVVAWIR